MIGLGRFAYFFVPSYSPVLNFFERKKSTYSPGMRPSGFLHTVCAERNYRFEVSKNLIAESIWTDAGPDGRTHGRTRGRTKSEIV